MAALSICLVVALLSLAVNGDIYLHNMRGSNNRLDEARRDRNNANRMFDSQNNNRGGYNVGSLYFFEGEQIPLEWSAQHACGNEYNDCQLVLQYMCSDNLRDGATTTTIPDQPSNCANNDCNKDVRYGMHEDYDYYTNCRFRYRNGGLFTADRNLNGNSARFTRQNEGGTRRGYECPEERDHYPYWHPSPWVDIAVFTSNASRCEFYQTHSENVLGRNYCKLPDDYYHFKVGKGGNNAFIPITKATCEALNNKGTEMNNLLLQKAATSYTSSQSKAIGDKRNCEIALAECSSYPNPYTSPNETDPSAFTRFEACNADFRTKAVTAADLETACPECATGKKLHPYSSCRTCIPNTCQFMAINETAFPETLCADGFQVDLLNSEWCIEQSCFNLTSTFEDAKSVDSCRNTFLSDKYLVDNKTTLNCQIRETLSADCFAQNIPRATWALNPPHNSTLPWLGAPFCREAEWSRVNHHGNGFGGFFNGYNLTFPSDYRTHCALRLRYNITTSDYNGLDPHNSSQVNNKLNGNPAKIPIRETHGIPMTDSAQPWQNARGYNFKNNPQVEIFDFAVFQTYCPAPSKALANDSTYCLLTNGKLTKATVKYCRYPHVTLDVNGTKCVGPNGATSDPITQNDANNFDFRLQLAINTAQFGRTFQDRTHTYSGMQRDENLRDTCDRIYSLNVRGKRGNIVQVYPGVEYDFVPNRLHITEGDCVHFQWTGSNTNPDNNDGQGKEGTDRSNIALMEYIRGEGGRGVISYGGKGDNGATWTTKDMKPGWEGWDYAAQSAVPTMGDVACPPPSSPEYSNLHPNNWRLCTLGQNKCTWVKASTNATGFYCPAGFTNDNFDSRMNNPFACVNLACKAAGYKDRPSNPTTWISGRDARNPSVFYNGSAVGIPDSFKHGTWGVSHPEHLDNVTRWGFIGLSYEQLVHLAILDNVQLGGEMSELDDAGTYFDLAPHKAIGKGVYHYMCTRNNNFSNRSQKGRIVVADSVESGSVIGSTGGLLTVSTSNSYTPANKDPAIIMSKSDFWVNVPPDALTAATHVSMTVIPASDTVGMKNAASDLLQLSPPDLAGKKTFPDIVLSAPAPARRRDVAGANETLVVSFQLVNASMVWFRIRSPFLVQYAQNLLKNNPQAPLEIAVTFQIEGSAPVVVKEDLNNQFELEGTWDKLLPNQLVAIEQGKLWISLSVNNTEFKGLIAPDPATGNPLVVRMPVSTTLTYGKIYYWPDTETGRACIYNVPGCAYVRQEIDARISDGEAVFTVGGSLTLAAGGYYQASSGSNLPIIVGVTVACLVVALALIGCAVYFRRYPQKWDAFKSWGPKKYKSLSRTFASRI